MSFFDSKEEVIKIELTQFGKYLLSIGKFKPDSYAFFDDDVVYDSKFMLVTESQNAAQTRILDETAITKPFYSHTSVESTSRESNTLIIKEDIAGLEKAEKKMLASGQTNASALFPLGTSSPNSEYFPAWNLDILKGALSVAFTSSDNSAAINLNLGPYLKIPQLFMETASYSLQILKKVEELKNYQKIVGVISRETDTYYVASTDTVNLFDLLENNVVDLKENFEIEVFIERKPELMGNVTKTGWDKLNFFKTPTNIKNNILLDNELYKESRDAIPDSSNVEYYFDLLVDEEIELPPEAKEKAASIYGTNITSADKPFGDDC